MSIDIRQAVLADIETKIAAGEDLHETIGRLDAATAALANAEAAVVEARRRALAAGWSESELKRLKLVPTTRTTRARATRPARQAGE